MEIVVFVVAVIALSIYGMWRVRAGGSGGPDRDLGTRPYDLRSKNTGQHSATPLGFPDDGSADLGSGKR